MWRVSIYVYSSIYVLQNDDVQCDVLPYASTHHYMYYRMPTFSVACFHIRLLIILYYRMLMLSVTCFHIRLLIINVCQCDVFPYTSTHHYNILQNADVITIYINKCWCLLCRVSIMIYIYSSLYVLHNVDVHCDVFPYTSTHLYVLQNAGVYCDVFSYTSTHHYMYYRMLMFSVMCSHIYVYSSLYVLQNADVQCGVFPYTSTHNYMYYRSWCSVWRVSIYVNSSL